VNIIDQYFKGNASFTNKFFPGATEDDIDDAEEILKIKFPGDYREFLRISNGFEGFINQFYLRLIPVGFIHDDSLDYCSERFAWALYLGTNGGGEMVVLDTRKQPFEFGLLPYLGEDDDIIYLGNSFTSFVEAMYNDEVFD